MPNTGYARSMQNQDWPEAEPELHNRKKLLWNEDNRCKSVKMFVFQKVQVKQKIAKVFMVIGFISIIFCQSVEQAIVPY